MTKFSVKLSNILGLSYYRYELTSSTYNAAIDTAFTITVKVTDVFGNNVSEKAVTLYHNGTSVSTQNTDSNGTYTWTITPSTWGLHDFNVANKHIQVNVDGWKLLDGYTSTQSFRFYRNKTHAKMILEGWGQTITFTSTWTQFGNASYAATIKPQGYVVGINNWGNVFFRINPDGKIYYRAISSNVSNTQTWMQLEWAIRDEDL